MAEVEYYAEHLLGQRRLLDEVLYLGIAECRIAIRSNSQALLKHLSRYFSHVKIDHFPESDIEILALDQPAVEWDLEFTDWAREPGKRGRKDSYLDLPGGRLIRKVKTGMLFLQSTLFRVAAGPCLKYDNQVINFINAQYMNWLQHRDWLICHAAGLSSGDQGIGFAGFSGGGKSTLMLHLLDDPKLDYLTNDRLFIRREGSRVMARGIPKLPRVNPGTIVHNSRLHPLLPEQRRMELMQLQPGELWSLEEKHDVWVQEVYGDDRVARQVEMNALVILNWERGGENPVQVKAVDLGSRRELLAAVMKSPGPFYQYPDGTFYQDNTALNRDEYLASLEGVSVYEVTGGIAFDECVRLLHEKVIDSI